MATLRTAENQRVAVGRDDEGQKPLVDGSIGLDEIGNGKPKRLKKALNLTGATTQVSRDNKLVQRRGS